MKKINNNLKKVILSVSFVFGLVVMTYLFATSGSNLGVTFSNLFPSPTIANGIAFTTPPDEKGIPWDSVLLVFSAFAISAFIPAKNDLMFE